MPGVYSIYTWLQVVSSIAVPAVAISPSGPATTTPAAAAAVYKHVQVPVGDHPATPAITPPPSLRHAALQKRASSSASFNTCGFIDDNANSALYCGGAYSCVFFRSTANTPGMAGCCADTSYKTCNWYSTCYDNAQLSTACTESACQSDALALRCTDTASPRCARWTWPALNVVDFACTYSEDDSGSTVTATTNWTTIAVSAVDTFFSEPTSYAVNVTWVPAAALTAKRPGDNDTSAVSTSGSSGTASASGSQPTATSGEGSGTPTGVIVGGVVGAIVGLIGLIAAAVMFCCLMKRRKRDQGSQQQQQQQDVPPLSPGVHELQQPAGYGYRPPAEVDEQRHTGSYQGNLNGNHVELGNGGGVARPVTEMEGRARPAEMDASGRRKEVYEMG